MVAAVGGERIYHAGDHGTSGASTKDRSQAEAKNGNGEEGARDDGDGGGEALGDVVSVLHRCSHEQTSEAVEKYDAPNDQVEALEHPIPPHESPVLHHHGDRGEG
eukprot:CAMPEP_0174748834 /NCGR_PEP_ID=MMETSP1094-20130205/94384_1 /TAXON_ID=156173 /ORGANISM="Chrysochromulina brevifilum, Strain UTEX LB 985" /LENGTH=104 /DNA_ID=CAMNT_0015953947 /DNA_START=363 /DNA_END=677 /DNA_ORIENTATION=-